MNPEQTTPPDVWYHDQLFYALTLVDIAVLLVIGIVWSAGLWVAVEGVKERLRLQKPYSPWERVILGWVPVIVSAVMCVVTMPFILKGLGQPAVMKTETIAISACTGIIGGLGSKGAHDVAGNLMRAALDRITGVIRGTK